MQSEWSHASFLHFFIIIFRNSTFLFLFSPPYCNYYLDVYMKITTLCSHYFNMIVIELDMDVLILNTVYLFMKLFPLLTCTKNAIFHPDSLVIFHLMGGSIKLIQTHLSYFILWVSIKLIQTHLSYFILWISIKLIHSLFTFHLMGGSIKLIQTHLSHFILWVDQLNSTCTKRY